ncbi:TIGR04086 family membrane protein [Paenibacillus sp. HN-1]|uniref:TIGR04086 family membrane protein n=1 Tax=Paenibacillus TaxID=44249 RepID=UPI001CA8D1C4|nr:MULTISPECIES: TIGR04086 family membrane protein [Paenibacillus]MBY9079630.1 TIGR04086 family membrane protein [Paenibacillus sp. CGMCC 1.18879]MBY9084319.1 TIGR04086 family membrane protein [Paenibacillus sinensis]
MHLLRKLLLPNVGNPVLSGLVRAFLWMLLGAFALSLLLWGSGLTEHDLSVYTYVVHALAIVFGGWASGRRASSKGWYQGCLTGAFYGLIVLLIGFLALDASLRAADILWIAAAGLIGAVGGILGVNFQKA